MGVFVFLDPISPFMRTFLCAFLLFIGLPLAVRAQGASRDSSGLVQILRSARLTYEARFGLPVQKLIGDVAVLKDSTYFYCDSAYIYEETDRIEAFNHVRVVMPDSVELKGDKLTYDPKTRIAEVYDHITLTDFASTLYTDRLTYYREGDYGYYSGGGKMINDKDTLTSETGYYYTKEKMSYFRTGVRLVSPDYVLSTDTLGYNTDTKLATFLAPTTIVSDDGEIVTSRGFYDTENRRIELFRRSTVKDSSYIITADTLFFDDNQNLGQAFGRVVVSQEDSSLEIRGELGRFNRKTEESFVTRKAVAIQFMEDDTLYIFADTLATRKMMVLVPKAANDSVRLDSATASPDSLPPASQDSLQVQPPKPKPDRIQPIPDSLGKGNLLKKPLVQQPDSLSPVPDSLPADSLRRPALSLPPPVPMDTVYKRVFLAYRKVSLFMGDVQGRADSAIYFYDDSTLTLHQKPILWSGDNQLTGDTVKIWMKNQKIDSMWIGESSFLVAKEDTVGFNQIKGKELRAKFAENELRRLHIIGNAESIYFLKDDKDTVKVAYFGMNKAFSQQMIVYLKDNKARKINFISKADGTMYPMFQAILEENRLEGMQWRIDERPERPDIFPKQAPAPAPPEDEADPALPEAGAQVEPEPKKD